MQGLLLAGRYRLVDTIGSGGMGRVWRAHDVMLHRTVAVKELTAALYASEGERARLLARTDAEARAAARVNHSAVVTVHDVLEHDDRPWIVMELIEGGSLADLVKERGRVEPREAARVGLWVLRALRAAHEAGVLHRDVKPGNVLLAEDGRVLLTDFGIAQVEGDTTITRTGEIVGSLDYIAPERVRGHDPGPASDLWALGATLYTAVEGKSPFRRTTPLTTMQAVVDEEPADPVNAGPLGPVITALLRKDPATRPTAQAVERMLAEAAEGRTPRVEQAYVPTRSTGLYEDATDRRAAGPTTPGTGMPAPAAPRKRRRGRTLVLAVVLAALVGGGTAVALQEWDEGRQENEASAGPSPTQQTSGSTPSTAPEGGIPADWETVDDPLGFGLSLPKGWKREVYGIQGDLKQIDYTPDDGQHVVRIAVDSSPDFDDPNAHLLDLDEQLRERLVDYERVSLRRHLYRDRQASRMEYTWTALAKDTDFPGPYRAVDQMYIARDGVEYAIYMSSPVSDWPTTRRQFEAVLRSWRPPSQ
ncbi:serine/threonine-protein kinase [Streptomyces sp. NPDC002845]